MKIELTSKDDHSMSEIITNNDAHYAFDIVKTIYTEVGPGLPGSSQERERAAIIKRELESHLDAGNVVIEEFTVAPGAFLGSLPISALFTLLAALLNISMGRFTGISPWVIAIAALACWNQRGSLQQGRSQGHDTASLQDASTIGGLLSPEVGWS